MEIYDHSGEKIPNPFGDHHEHDVAYMLLKDKVVATIPGGKPMFSFYGYPLQWKEIELYGGE